MTGSEFIPKQSRESSPQAERRTAERSLCRQDPPFRLIIARRYECQWAQGWDVSADGISFLVSTQLEPGALVFVRLRDQENAAPLTLLAEVMHATARPDGRWLVGCRFDSVGGNLNEAERAQLRNELQHQPELPRGAPGQGRFSKELTAKLFFPFAPVF